MLASLQFLSVLKYLKQCVINIVGIKRNSRIKIGIRAGVNQREGGGGVTLLEQYYSVYRSLGNIDTNTDSQE